MLSYAAAGTCTTLTGRYSWYHHTNKWLRSCPQLFKAWGLQGVTHLARLGSVLPARGLNVQTCGLKLTEISWVAGSLLINGRLRLYWELSPTVSVHVSYSLLECLESQTQRTQSAITIKQKLLSQKNNLYLSRHGTTLFNIPIKTAGAFILQCHGRATLQKLT